MYASEVNLQQQALKSSAEEQPPWQLLFLVCRFHCSKPPKNSSPPSSALRVFPPDQAPCHMASS